MNGIFHPLVTSVHEVPQVEINSFQTNNSFCSNYVTPVSFQTSDSLGCGEQIQNKMERYEKISCDRVNCNLLCTFDSEFTFKALKLTLNTISIMMYGLIPTQHGNLCMAQYLQPSRSA